MFNAPTPPQSEMPSPRSLIRSTVIAVAVATILLVTVVLPAEYGIDATGAGRVLGLTRMGEVKMALAREAAADALADSIAAAAEAEAEAAAAAAAARDSAHVAPTTIPATSVDSIPAADPGQGRDSDLERSRE